MDTNPIENKAIPNAPANKGRNATTTKGEPDPDAPKPFGRGACPKCGISAEMAHESETGKLVYLHDCPGAR